MLGCAKTTHGSKNSKEIDEACSISQPKHNDIIGEIIIYVLAGICILLFLFISIGFFFIAKPLKASLKSVTIRNLRYNDTTSTSPYFNATMAMEISIKNPNPGHFEFATSKGEIFYNGDVVGEFKIDGERVDSFDAIRTKVMADLSYSSNQRSSMALKNDIQRRLLIINIKAKLRGEVHLMVLNKRSVKLKCLMYVNLNDEVIQHLWCK